MNPPKLTRRSLLKKSGALAAGAAAGFPAVVPSRVFGAAAPSKRIHLALLGAGERGTGVMQGFATNEDCRFVAVCDPFKSRRDAAVALLHRRYAHDGVDATADYREVMARDDVDAVVVCSADHWHVPLAMAAARAGKDAYVEKPLSPSLQWSWRLRDVVRLHGRVVQYGTQQRSSASFRRACELVLNGYVGQVRRVDAWCIDGARAAPWRLPESLRAEPVPADLAYDLWQGPAREAPYSHWRVHRDGFFHNYEYSIGFIAGWGAHPLDIAQWGLDADDTSPVEYSGTGKIPTRGLYSTVYDWDVHCRYSSGVSMHFVSWPLAKPIVMKYRRRESDHGTTFFGDEGWISVDRGGIEASDPKLLTQRLKPGDRRLPFSEHHDRNFLDCVRTRQRPVSHLKAAICSDTISHLSDVAIRLGRTVRWDPAAERAIDDVQADRMLLRPMRPPYVF